MTIFGGEWLVRRYPRLNTKEPPMCGFLHSSGLHVFPREKTTIQPLALAKIQSHNTLMETHQFYESIKEDATPRKKLKPKRPLKKNEKGLEAFLIDWGTHIFETKASEEEKSDRQSV